MAVNLSKIHNDLSHPDVQIQTFALMCITRLSPQIVQSPDEIRGIRKKLGELSSSENPDVIFLARKAINHLDSSFHSVLDGNPRGEVPAVAAVSPVAVSPVAVSVPHPDNVAASAGSSLPEPSPEPAHVPARTREPGSIPVQPVSTPVPLSEAAFPPPSRASSEPSVAATPPAYPVAPSRPVEIHSEASPVPGSPTPGPVPASTVPSAHVTVPPEAAPESRGDTLPMGRRDAEALPLEVLLERIRFGGDPVSLANLTIALVSRSDRSCLEVVRPLLGHNDYRVRGNAVEVLASFADPQIAEDLVPLLEDSNNRVRGNAVLALAQVDHPQVRPALQSMLGSRMISMRESAAWAATQIDKPYAEGLLIQASKDPYEGIRLRAIKSLGRFLSRESIEVLRGGLNDIDINVCEAAAESLREIKIKLIARRQAQAAQLARSTRPSESEGSPVPTPSVAPPASKADVAAAASGVATTPIQVRANDATADDATANAATPSPDPSEPSPEEAEADSTHAPPVEDKTAGMAPLLLNAYLEFGHTAYKLCRESKVTHELLDGIFYDLLRCQDFLAAYTARRDKGDADLNISMAIQKLEIRVRENLVGLGRQSAILYEGKMLRVPDLERSQIMGQLDRIRKAKKAGRGD